MTKNLPDKKQKKEGLRRRLGQTHTLITILTSLAHAHRGIIKWNPVINPPSINCSFGVLIHVHVPIKQLYCSNFNTSSVITRVCVWIISLNLHSHWTPLPLRTATPVSNILYGWGRARLVMMAAMFLGVFLASRGWSLIRAVLGGWTAAVALVTMLPAPGGRRIREQL